MRTLTASLKKMKKTKLAYEAACRKVWTSLLATHPEVSTILQEWGVEEEAGWRWFCAPYFDDGSKSAVELFDEGRGSEVILRIGQIAQGVYR